MIFVSLIKFRGKPTKEGIARATKDVQAAARQGVKVLGWYWTLGRYDAVLIAEAPDVKTVMRQLLKASDRVSTETLVAMPRAQAIKLVE